MAKAKPTGTSEFTYKDDLGAEVHTTDPDHHEAMFYGGEVPGKTELKEVVLGPPAFGSPDPRTLGHVMNPASGEPADSAPEVSADYAGGKPLFSKVSSAHEDDSTFDDDESDKPSWNKSMTKAELLEEAQLRGLDVTEENTKDEIVSALEDSEDEDDS